MRNIKLTIEYDGTRYQGWQRPGKKDNSATISGKIIETFYKMTGESIELFGGAKTEPGVHAAAQIASFKTNCALSVETIRQELNHYLPQDISILSAAEMPERFHAGLNARSQTYLYRIDCAPVENVFTRKYLYHTVSRLNVDDMRQAAELFTGIHDFKNFSTGKSKKSTEKELFEISILVPSETPSGTEFQILLKGNDFLRQMPRLIVGTLLDIGTGQRSISCIERIFSGEESSPPPASAHGLCLTMVDYLN